MSESNNHVGLYFQVNYICTKCGWIGLEADLRTGGCCPKCPYAAIAMKRDDPQVELAALRQQVEALTRENAEHKDRHQANKRIKEGLIRERDLALAKLAKVRAALVQFRCITCGHESVAPVDGYVCPECGVGAAGNEYFSPDWDDAAAALAPPPAEG